MAIIKTIKNLLGEVIYPVTKAKAVYMEDNRTVEDAINNIDVGDLPELDDVAYFNNDTGDTYEQVNPVNADLSEGHSASYFATASEMTAVETEISNLDNTVTTLNSAVNTLNSNITSITGDINTIEGNITTINNNITSLDGELSTAQSDISDLDGQVGTLSDDVSSIVTTLSHRANNNLIPNTIMQQNVGNSFKFEFGAGSNNNIFAPFHTFSQNGTQTITKNGAWLRMAFSDDNTNVNSLCLLMNVPSNWLNQTFTISFDCKWNTATTAVLYIFDGNNPITSISSQSFSMTTSEQRYSHSFVMPSSVTNNQILIWFNRCTGVNGRTCDIKNIKMEFGDTATPYQPDIAYSTLYSLMPPTNNNILINGDFQVWQRDAVSTALIVCDMWLNINTTTTPQTQLSTGGIRITKISGTSTWWIRYYFSYNDIKKYIGKTLAFSIKIKKNREFSCMLRSYFTGSQTDIIYIDNNSVGKYNIYTGLQYISNIDDTKGTDLYFGLVSDGGLEANDYIDIEWIKIEEGTFVTPFYHRSYDEELRLCQQYYYKSPLSTYFNTLVGIANSTGISIALYFEPLLNMRTDLLEFATVSGTIRWIRINENGTVKSLSTSGCSLKISNEYGNLNLVSSTANTFTPCAIYGVNLADVEIAIDLRNIND